MVLNSEHFFSKRRVSSRAPRVLSLISVHFLGFERVSKHDEGVLTIKVSRNQSAFWGLQVGLLQICGYTQLLGYMVFTLSF